MQKSTITVRIKTIKTFFRGNFLWRNGSGLQGFKWKEIGAEEMIKKAI